MPDNTQANRPIRLTTPLGTDALLLVGFGGTETISELFHFQLEMLRPHNKGAVAFDGILGQLVTIELELPGGGKRHFHGLVNRFTQGKIVRFGTSADESFIQYKAEVVPQFWLWTKKIQSRIFQHKTVPDILKEVLKGLKVDWKIQGTFQPRDYCAQYRESDFDFASRLMEEEGIYYYFKHADGSHEMVVSNVATGHADLPAPKKIIYEEILGGTRPEQRITRWEKVQELRSGKVTLWDHCFELPHKHLEADKTIAATVQAGTVSHKLAVNGVDKLELYDYPGAYAQRLDGIDKGGSPQAAELQKIFDDNKRTVEIRMQEEAAEALVIDGAGSCGHMSPGHKFTLERHFDANGDYILTRVEHSGTFGANYRSGEGDTFSYKNTFECIPAAVPYRPDRTTERPTVQGSQSAVVVGPAGEEIFTDKYGRVKVQFHWDRQGKNDADSACWVRVGTMWAGKNWGMIHIPRIGQEVIVDFLEGDPDQPIIVGSVYNADQMPPWDLPANKTQSGIQTRSSPGGSPANHNQIRFEDKKGSEQVHIHAEKNQDIEVENDETHWVGHDRKKTIDHDETTLVKHDRTETVNNNETITIDGNRVETVHKNETITIDINRTEKVGANEKIDVVANRTRTVGANESVTVGASRTLMVAAAQAITVGAAQAITVGGAQAITVGAAQVITVADNETTTIGGGRTEKVAKDESVSIGGGQTLSIAGGQTTVVDKNRTVNVKGDEALDVGKTLALTAKDSITLTTGDASITMKKDGTIIIKGKDITVEGSGKITAKASGDMILKGSKINQN